MDNNSSRLPVFVIAGLILTSVLIGGAFALVSKGNKPNNTSDEQNESKETFEQTIDSVPTTQNKPEEIIQQNTNEDTTSESTLDDTTSANPPVDQNIGMELVYKNGEYETTGSYMSPAGSEEIGVTMDIENDVITSVSVTPKATNDKSIKFQNDFKAKIADYVVGKKIDELEIPGVVNGSSLTGTGFKEAIEKIKEEASV